MAWACRSSTLWINFCTLSGFYETESYKDTKELPDREYARWLRWINWPIVSIRACRARNRGAHLVHVLLDVRELEKALNGYRARRPGLAAVCELIVHAPKLSNPPLVKAFGKCVQSVVLIVAVTINMEAFRLAPNVTKGVKGRPTDMLNAQYATVKAAWVLNLTWQLTKSVLNVINAWNEHSSLLNCSGDNLKMSVTVLRRSNSRTNSCSHSSMSKFTSLTSSCHAKFCWFKSTKSCFKARKSSFTVRFSSVNLAISLLNRSISSDFAIPLLFHSRSSWCMRTAISKSACESFCLATSVRPSRNVLMEAFRA